MQTIQARISAAAGTRPVTLVAVSKTRSAAEVAALAALGVTDFGENYVQELLTKQAAVSPAPVWHLIGPLQSNKAAAVAPAIDWMHTLDRAKLIPLLARARAGRPPLKLLIQVNVDAEDSKSGIAATLDAVLPLAEAVLAEPALCWRGLMCIPEPGAPSATFARMRTLFEQLRERHPDIDTLSMGMSEDYELAIREGATMVRIGSALFGPRPIRGS
ncbi:MAG: YggS family pyridoxal phosphate-dependent enzyme [Xanthomonadales bacterium]|nr:YggS family pyridoxal phosphate-dependent enzyme [Xanthomonadales bacterium]